MPPDLSNDPRFFALLCESYRRFLQRSLVTTIGGDARWLFEEAPFAVLAHDAADDPRFIYANRAAQECFGYTWNEIVGLPSRLSAEAPDRAERQDLLASVTRDGFAIGYSGFRIAKSGRRFPIADGIVWQLVDAQGAVRGQAATFRLP